ncbi:MAG: hypothetical protein LUD82_03510 [Clostridiales bacterium]|nr:hypothetical protein [Clostridiales bacterium]
MLFMIFLAISVVAGVLAFLFSSLAFGWRLLLAFAVVLAAMLLLYALFMLLCRLVGRQGSDGREHPAARRLALGVYDLVCFVTGARLNRKSLAPLKEGGQKIILCLQVSELDAPIVLSSLRDANLLLCYQDDFTTGRTFPLLLERAGCCRGGEKENQEELSQRVRLGRSVFYSVPKKNRAMVRSALQLAQTNHLPIQIITVTGTKNAQLSKERIRLRAEVHLLQTLNAETVQRQDASSLQRLLTQQRRC